MAISKLEPNKFSHERNKQQPQVLTLFVCVHPAPRPTPSVNTHTLGIINFLFCLPILGLGELNYWTIKNHTWLSQLIRFASDFKKNVKKTILSKNKEYLV